MRIPRGHGLCRQHRDQVPAAACTAEGCGRVQRAKGLCVHHYNRGRAAVSPECTIPDCTAAQQARGWCNTHYARWYRLGDPGKVSAAGYVRASALERECYCCQKVKSRENFPISNRTKRMGTWCLQCIESHNDLYQRSQKRVDLNHARKALIREQTLSRVLAKHGMSVDDYRGMIKRQGDKCAICGTDRCDPSGRMQRWCIDHDHTTGQVRGLLCRACNLGLGSFADNKDRMHAAIAYLSR